MTLNSSKRNIKYTPEIKRDLNLNFPVEGIKNSIELANKIVTNIVNNEKQ
jgi:hypothetical protein